MKPTKRQLKQMYCNDKLSSLQIAEKVGVTKTSILRWLKEYKINARSSSEAQRCRPRRQYKSEINHVSGYMRVWNPNMKKYVWKHRQVWEEHYGKIPDGMVIHHINGIKSDNRIKNLCITTQSKHVKNHVKYMLKVRKIKRGF